MSAELTTPTPRTGFHLVLYPTALEAGGSLRVQAPRALTGAGGGAAKAVAEGLAGEVARALAAQRSRQEADRRARGAIRRYAVANRTNRLITLTYATSCRDPRQVRADVRSFFRKLRAGLGGQPMPYLWLTEWHPGPRQHGLHVHALVATYVPRQLIERAWGRGFVHVKLIGSLPGGAAGGAQQEAARAAKYVAKYVGKTLDGRRAGQHRYEVAEGFAPPFERVWGLTEQAALAAAAERLGKQPAYVWRSQEHANWSGPPTLWASWV